MNNRYWQFLKKKVRHLLHPVVGEVWCLHRVVPERSSFSSNRDLEITPNYLEKLINDYKKRGFQFVDIDTINKNIGVFKKQKVVNISFDDGFKDIYSYAYPIFKKHNTPFTLYLTTDFPNGNIFLWWMILEDIILSNNAITLKDNESYNCGTLKEKQIAFEKILEKIYRSELNMREYFKQLFEDYLDEYKFYNDKMVLSWEEIKEMVDSGLCTIGSHSVSHPALSKLKKEEAFTEIYESKKIIEKEIEKEIKHFSYPHSFYNETLMDLVKQSGYSTAVLGYGGTIRYDDEKFKLKRNYIVEN